MAQIGILSGIYADHEFRAAYPMNLEPVVLDSGLSKGYLKSAAGISGFGTGPGADRGGIEWNGVLYRVMGTSLVSVAPDGAVTTIGEVGGTGRVSLDYSFDHLMVRSGTNVWLHDRSALTRISDVDLGSVVDGIWIDGYFMFTDGVSVIVTELNDPFSVNPLKYGSSEEDPDPVNGLIKIRGEAYVLNRYTIEVLRNVGGNGFPFAVNGGAIIPKGCIGTHAKCLFADSFAFVGSGRNEALGVYQAGAGQVVKLSTRQIDDELAAVDEGDWGEIHVEARISRDEQRLYVHLPTKTLVFVASASLKATAPIWYQLAGGVEAGAPYPARGFVQCYGRTICGDLNSSALGEVDDGISTCFGDVRGWAFETALIYNESRGGILHGVELVQLAGRAPFGVDPVVFFSFTRDGQAYSQERALATGTAGQRNKRAQWRPHVRFANFMGLRFRGADAGMNGIARVEAEIEGLSS